MEKIKAPWYYLAILILAGESVFFLPYVLSRIFRPTVLEVFQINNVELGLCFSVYGMVAIISYLFGGPIADKYPPRKLIAVALWLTSFGGLIYASFPSFFVLKVLYGYWGFTTVFLFWAPMIKAARLWGASSSQLKAFGWLEGGRGIVGALIGTIGVLIFALIVNEDLVSVGIQESRAAFKYVIYFTSISVAFVGVFVWFSMRLKGTKEVVLERIELNQMFEVLKLPSVRLLMVIIMCAYMGYKTTDVISLYASDVMKYSQVKSAQVATFLLYARPVVAIFVVLFFSRLEATFLLFIGFVISFLGALLFSLGVISSSMPLLFMLSILVLAIGVYALRALYFSVMEKGQIPILLTGTAVGLISLVGYAPDIFSGPMIGYFLDHYPGIEGHQYVFFVLALFSFFGALASWRYHVLYKTT